MRTLSGVSARNRQIYFEYYSDRESQRFEVLYEVFCKLADFVETASPGTKVVLDYERLGESIRSYFLDTIRYKEYHFDPEPKPEKVQKILDELKVNSFEEIDPLSVEWTRLVHETVNINASKVAAYTVKWLLQYKPISVFSDGDQVNDTSQLGIISNINELYALNCALLELKLDAGDIQAKKLDELVYCFRFRNFDEASYFMILTKDYLLNGEKDYLLNGEGE
jgi:hypothetical protein